MDETVYDYSSRLRQVAEKAAAKEESKASNVEFYQRGGVAIISTKFDHLSYGLGIKSSDIKYIKDKLKRGWDLVSVVICSHIAWMPVEFEEEARDPNDTVEDWEEKKKQQKILEKLTRIDK